MTDLDRAEILRRFEAGEDENDIWFDPKWSVSFADIQAVLRAELARRKEAQEIAMGLFHQACAVHPLDDHPRYDHECTSAYEEAQEYLIDIGRVKPEECVRI